MITYVQGSLFDSPAQVLVNTVNTEGVMGKGIALQFKKIYPDMFAQYQQLCEKGQIDIGRLWIYRTSHKWILNFPTKRSWRQPSQIDYIEKGLKKFVDEYAELRIHSIAFPALGCGNGELDWEKAVRPLMENYLSGLPISVFIHPPLTREEIPEHRSQKETIEWLRSEPRTLPFSEVWMDLKKLVHENPSFETGVRGYVAEIIDDEVIKEIVLTTEDRDYRMDYEELREIWSRFRTLGYLKRGFVTVRTEKMLSYLMPVLAELPYVHSIKLYEKGRKAPYKGLQYVASSDKAHQPTLFG